MNETTELDLREWGKVLLKRIWIIILCAVLMGAAVLIYTANFVPPKYKAEVTMYLNNSSSGDDRYMDSSDYAVALRQVETYTNIISSNAVLEKVAEATGLVITGDQIRGMMTASAVGETEMFKVSILSGDPELSALIANTIADVAPGEISKFGLGSVAKVVDYARVPTSRYSPSYTVNTAAGALVGALLAAVVVILQVQLDVRVKKEEDLTRILAAPVLGTIPELTEEHTRVVRRKGAAEMLLNRKKKTKPAATGKEQPKNFMMQRRLILSPNSPFALQEAYKTLRTNIRFSLRGDGCKKICITSSNAGEGKSITLLNLAISFAETGKKVLLVDADLRRPAIARLMVEKATPGLSNVLADLNTEEEAIHKDAYPNLDILFSGDVPPNPSELLSSERMQLFVENMSKFYDYILIDTPPVNVVSDSCVVANLADGVLLLVRQGRTRKDSVKQAVAQLQLTGANILGFVLNGVDTGLSMYYSYEQQS